MLSLAEKLEPFDCSLPLERARTIPSAWYWDPDIYQAECRRIFWDGWQALGRIDQVKDSGDFFTENVAGEPIVVLRDANGELRGFHNVCRHRAAQVLNQAQGKVTKLRCRYHGWTYDLSGKLRGTPEFDGTHFCKEDNGLVGIAVDSWGPLVFGHVGEPQQLLSEHLAPFVERAQEMGLDKLHFAERREYEVACNWKVYVDNFLDGGYHVNTVHPGLASALDYSRYRTEILGHASVQSSPMKVSADDAVQKVRSGHAHYWWIFPNLMVNLYSGVMDVNLVVPLGPDRCRVLFDFYFPEVESEVSRRYIAESIAVAHQVQVEDMEICEEVQRGLKSASYDTGRFSVKREAAGYHFHRLLARQLRDQ